MAHYEYHKNPFTHHILTLTRQAQDEAFARGEGKKGANNWDTLTDAEKYIMGAFNLYVRLDHVAEQLNHIIVYLKRYPFGKSYAAHNINALVYTQYHTEVWTHKIHTVLELMRLLVNKIYGFNIAEKDCSWDVLKTCPGIKGSPIEKILNSYFKSFKHIINTRHLNTHRGWYEDEEMEKLTTPLFLINKSQEYGLELPVFSDKDHINGIKQMVKEFRVKRGAEMAKTNEVVYTFINNFYKELDKVFTQQLNAYQPAEQRP